MKLEDLKLIEDSLNILLPNHYKEFQINYPENLRVNKFNRSFFSEDPQYLIEINKFWMNDDHQHELFSIGSDVGGNYYFIKLNDNEQAVYYWDHEDVSSEESDEIDNWYDLLKSDHKNLVEFSDWLINFWGGDF